MSSDYKARIGEVLTRALTGMAVAGAVVAYFSLAVVAQVDPWALYKYGLTLGVCAATTYIAVHIGQQHQWPAALLIAAFPVAILIYAMYQAGSLEEKARIELLANDRRCMAIQNDMLSARPRKENGADLFQALGCRPQGEGSVYVPPPKVAAANR